MPDLLIVDACVLIDFLGADETVLSSIARGVGPIHVAQAVLDEVDGLDAARAAELGLTVVEPSFELASEAAAQRRGLSFADRVCLLLARERGWVCVSNDRALRAACGEDGVRTFWGLEVLALAVEVGEVPVPAALELAEAIARENPFITSAILERFRARVQS